MEAITNLIIRTALWFKHSSARTLLLSFGFPFLLTLGTYFVLIPILRSFSSDPLTYAADVLVARGPIPYVITFFFWLSIGILMLKGLMVELESFAFREIKSKLKLKNTMVYTDSQDIIKGVKKEEFADIQNSLVVRRIIHGMQRLFRTQDTNALSDYFKLRSELEYAEMESGFSVVKYINWLIPTLGFIGTVLGIGFGIAGFASIIEDAQNFDQIRRFLPQVTSSLGVAFDTTFLALILSVVGMFLTSFISKKYSRLLEEIDAYCLDDISSKFQLHSTTAEQLKDVLREMKEEIGKLMGANRIQLSNLVEDSLSNISDEIIDIHHTLKESPGKALDFDSVLRILHGIKESLDKRQPDINLEPMVQAIKEVKSSVDEKQIAMNLDPVIDSLQQIRTELSKAPQKKSRGKGGEK